jgi:tetratricopeptide (TPR) repeat protein
LKKIKQAKPQTGKPPEVPAISVSTSTPKAKYLGIAVFAFGFLLYVQSITFGFVLDDEATITKNHLVQQGFQGIPTIMVTDFWHGSDMGVKIPIYRPGSMVLFAMEWQLFGDSPMMFHLVNVILYALTCWLLFMLLARMLKEWNILFSFLAALFYVAHPIHTEVVNNIKSADEILCFLFTILATMSALKFSQKQSPLHLLLMAGFYFLSVFSKESGIVMIAGIPLMLYFFTNAKAKNLLTIGAVLVAVVIPYILLRSNALQSVPVYEHSAIVNTAYTTTDFISQRATALFTLLKYEWLLIFPHPLSYNYDFAQIPLQTITSPLVIVSIVVQLLAMGLALNLFRKKHMLSFAILFFFITISIVSNLVIIIGTNMAERFLFIPSMGYCLALTWILFKIFKVDFLPGAASEIKNSVSSKPIFLTALSIITLLYMAKTLIRSRDWKDNIALFGHDVKIASQSAPAHYHWGNALMSQLYPNEQDPAKKETYLKEAIIEYQTAIGIYPRYPDAILHVGDAFNKLGDITKAITFIEGYNQLMQNSNPDALRYLAQLYGQAGQQEKGITMYKNMLATGSPHNAELYYSIGSMYNQKQDYGQAITYLDSCLQYNPNHQSALSQKVIADLNLQRNDDAIATGEKLIMLDPQNQKVYTYLGVAYANLGNYTKAIEVLQKAIQLDPNDQESQQRLKVLEDFQR